MLTKGAIGNLINRYRAVLKKCHLINTFGSLAVASMLVMGGAVAAGATAVTVDSSMVLTAPLSNKDTITFVDGGSISVARTGTGESVAIYAHGAGINTKISGPAVINVSAEEGHTRAVEAREGATITTGSIVINATNTSDTVTHSLYAVGTGSSITINGDVTINSDDSAIDIYQGAAVSINTTGTVTLNAGIDNGGDYDDEPCPGGTLSIAGKTITISDDVDTEFGSTTITGEKITLNDVDTEYGSTTLDATGGTLKVNGMICTIGSKENEGKLIAKADTININDDWLEGNGNVTITAQDAVNITGGVPTDDDFRNAENKLVESGYINFFEVGKQYAAILLNEDVTNNAGSGRTAISGRNIDIDGSIVALNKNDVILNSTGTSTIEGDVLLFNGSTLALAAGNDVNITGTISNRPEAVVDEDTWENMEKKPACGGNITISGQNVTLSGDIWNERSYYDTTMAITADDKLTIRGNVDNQSVLNISAKSLDYGGGYLNFDGDNTVTVTNDATIGTIGDDAVAPIVAAGNLTFTAGNESTAGTVVINGGQVKDGEIIDDVKEDNKVDLSGRNIAILGGTVRFDNTTQSFTADTLEINGDIVAIDNATVALNADTGSINGNILTTDTAKVTMDGAFTMDGEIEGGGVTVQSGTLIVNAASLGTVGDASAVTTGIKNFLTVNAGATLTLDLADFKMSDGSVFRYTTTQLEAARNALFGNDDAGNLVFANAIEGTEQDALIAISKWQNGKAWTLSSGEDKGNYFGGGLAYKAPASSTCPNASITIAGGKLIGEINGGGAAIGEGATAHVDNVEINVTGGTIISMTDHPDGEFYSPIRGGGVAMDGGSVTVGKVVMNFTGGDVTQWNPDTNSAYGTTEIMGGGCVVGSGSSVTDEVEINIGKDFSLGKRYDVEGGGYNGNSVSVYGGGDGDTVGKTTINVDTASFNDAIAFSMFGGGMASDGVDSSVETSVINITGDSSVTGEGYGYIFGGGSADNGDSANVENATINIKGGHLGGHEIAGGGTVGYKTGATETGGTANTGTSTINISGGVLDIPMIYGGGQNYGDQNSTTNTENATINISGGKIIDAEIIGGSFKRYANGTANVGTTNINISGGEFVSNADNEYSSMVAFIFGGSQVEEGTATVETANINITGGIFEKVEAEGRQGIEVYGGGNGHFVEGVAVKTKNTNVNISSVNMAGADIFGGGLGATSTDNAVVKISDATVHNVYGGGQSGTEYGRATVDNVSITISDNSKINDVYGAYLVSGDTAENNTMNTLKISIDGAKVVGRVAAAEVVDTDASMSINRLEYTVNDATIANALTTAGKQKDGSDNYTIANEAHITITGATSVGSNVVLRTTGGASSITIDTNEFSLDGVLNGNTVDSALIVTDKVTDFLENKFKNFDTLEIQGATSILKADESGIGSFTAENVGSTLALTGKGELTANVSDIAGKLSITNGTLSSESITVAEGGSLVVDGGSLKTASDQVFSAGLGDGTVADPSTVKTGLTFTKGDLTLTDDWYNLGYVSKAEDLIGDATSLTLLGELKNAGNLVIGTDEGDNKASVDSVDSSLGSVTLEGGDTVIVNDNKEVTILGDIATKEDGKKANLAVGSDTAGSATVNLGDADKAEDSGGSISGKASVAANSQLNVNGGSFDIGEVELGSDAELNVKAELRTEKLSAAADSKLEVSGKLSADVMEIAGKASIDGETIVEKLTAAANAIINVGSDAAAGVLSAVESALKGAQLFLDPNWTTDGSDTIEMASKAALGTVADMMAVDGQIAVGRNSVLTLGTDDVAWAENVFNASGLSWGKGSDQISAAVALAKPISVSAANGGSLRVDGSLTSASFAAMNTVEFAANSLLLVDGAVAKAGAIKGDGATVLTVNDCSKLYIQNANAGEYNFATDLADTSTLGGWASIATNAKVEASAELVGGNIVVTATSKAIEESYPNIIAVNAINGMKVDTTSSNMGVQFLSKAIDDPTQSLDVEGLVNEVSRGAVTAGVQNTALRIADAASNTVLDHMSLANHGGNAVHADGVDFWAAPMYGNLYTSGMVANGASVRGQFGGLALGADLEAGQFFGGKFRIGAAINGGGGQSDSKGTSVSAQNDYGFGGVNLYAGWNKDALNIIGSIGYVFGDNEVEMGLPVAMNTAKADVDTGAFTADLRAEYQLKTNWVDIMPHAGIRYTALHTDSHDFKVDGKKLNSLESDTQHIVQFPVGVTLSKDFDVKGWNVKPMADVSVIPAAGDKKTSGKVRFSGVDAVDSFDARIMDSTSWAGTVGVQAEKGDFSLGLNYGVQASSHETNQNIQLKLSWKF